ncbi:MAG: polysaccharide biosynthesis C-terminal domain-containing protein [Nostoc sp. NMS1]|uniref:murein biosynthesis integral membrane protein MurJ n=1 Tax=Nostoc sp. NMS1 TaxID=2815388 RepID=UPI0025E118FC|nr:lipid II flippase MurJ [Nostoc sp. NMS1]MBN3907570.1 polysaccharide biosynthesis C-terminal domain-containing protein [Nostoc sp. NMS1]
MKIWQLHNLLDYWKKLTSGSVNRQILGAAITVAFGTALVKVVAVVREIVIAWKFGTGDELDAFLIALLVPEFIINVVAGSFNAALIPTYIRVREEEGAKAAQRLFSGATVWSLGLLGITTILIVASAPLYLPHLASGFSAEKVNLTFKLLCVISPIVMLTGIVTIWSAVLNAGERFALTALSPIMTPVITIVLLFLGGKFWGVFALAVGLVGGAVLEITLLGIALRRQRVSLLPRWYGFDDNLRQVANQYAPMIAGGFLMCSTGIVDQAMAATLLPGSVAALNYGNRLSAFPITLMTQALSTAVIPYFSTMVAREDWVGVRHTLKHYMKSIFAVTLPISLLIILFSGTIVQILFQRGLFTANDTQLVANIQAFNALQIPLRGPGILVVRFISATRSNQILMWGSGFNLMINIALDYLFIQWLGVAGIALSTSCVYMFSFFFLLFFAIKKINKKSIITNG